MTSIRSFIKKLLKSEGKITIVSGLPRSGTSMMMSALEAGGLPLLTDGLRQADLNNPKGYFEYEPVKKLPKGQTGWLLSADGKAVKVISALLTYLPEDFQGCSKEKIIYIYNFFYNYIFKLPGISLICLLIRY